MTTARFITILSYLGSFFIAKVLSYHLPTVHLKRSFDTSISLIKFNTPFTTQKPSKTAIDLKTVIIENSKNSQNGILVNEEGRKVIAEAVASLEKINPVSNISKSPKIKGTWKLIYTTNAGTSAGKIGPFVGEVFQDIGSSEYINIARLFNGLLEVSLGATWDIKNANNWQVNFQYLVFKALGLKISEKSLKGVSGNWRMTYLDDNFRILWAIGGKNTKVENVFILTKQ